MHDFWARLKNKTFACKSWSDYQITSYVLKKICILCAGWTGRKYWELQKRASHTRVYMYIRGCLDSLENQQLSLSVHMGNIKGCDDVFRVSQALGMSVSWRGNPDGLSDGTFCALFHKQLWLQPWRSSFSCLIKGESEPSFYALFTSALRLIFVLFWFFCLCFKMCFLRRILYLFGCWENVQEN